MRFVYRDVQNRRERTLLLLGNLLASFNGVGAQGDVFADSLCAHTYVVKNYTLYTYRVKSFLLKSYSQLFTTVVDFTH